MSGRRELLDDRLLRGKHEIHRPDSHLRLTRGVKQYLRAGDIGVNELSRALDAAVHVRLGGEVDHRVELLGHQAGHKPGIGDIPAHKAMPPGARVLFDVGQVVQVAGVGEQVEVDDVVHALIDGL